MKKRLLVAMALIVSLMMAACDDGEAGAGSDSKNAYELYSEAYTALNEADSIDMDVTTNYFINFDEEIVDMKIVSSTKEVFKGETDVDMEIDMAIDAAGDYMTIKGYYTDGYYLYQEMDGQKFKMKMDASDALVQANKEAIVLTEDAILDSEITEENGETIVSFTLKSSAVKGMIPRNLASMVDTSSLDEAKTDFGEATFIGVIKDGELKSAITNFMITMEFQGKTIEINCDTEMVITQIGGVTVDLPTDLDTYVEIPSAY